MFYAQLMVTVQTGNYWLKPSAIKGSAHLLHGLTVTITTYIASATNYKPKPYLGVIIGIYSWGGSCEAAVPDRQLPFLGGHDGAELSTA